MTIRKTQKILILKKTDKLETNGLRGSALFKVLSLFLFCEEVTMNKYLYDGPVMEFDMCVEGRWKASTHAVSEKKARSNLTFQYKRQSNRMPNTKISLPSKITLAS